MGPVRFRRLEEAFGSGAGALAAGPSAWAAVEGIGAVAGELARELNAVRARAEEEAVAMEKAGVRALIPGDDEYPEGLKTLEDRPFLLYISGRRTPVDDLAVAVVGSRRPTAYGRAAAERLARELAEAGVTVVSGLARGIDGVAHEAVVKKKGRTIGVLGSGLGRFYPPEHRNLAARMAERGAVLTEFSWGTGPLPGHFPRRNRLIAGMSLGVVVVEADIKSGALITARLAADQGREVFAVPGSIFSPLSRGSHLLLKEGARPVEDAEDVLNALEVFRDLLRRLPAAPPAGAQAPSPNLAPDEEALLSRISLDPLGVDDLAAGSRLAAGPLAAALLNLELKGLVRSLPGKTYVRAEAALKG
jgi:DNA processing protein